MFHFCAWGLALRSNNYLPTALTNGQKGRVWVLRGRAWTGHDYNRMDIVRITFGQSHSVGVPDWEASSRDRNIERIAVKPNIVRRGSVAGNVCAEQNNGKEEAKRRNQ